MMKKKLSIPILLVLTLSILGQILIQSPTGYGYPAIYIDPLSIVDAAGSLTQITVNVTTDYTGDDIWGYQFTLIYNPLVLSGATVTNGDRITNATAPAFFIAGDFDNVDGKLDLTAAAFDSPLDSVGGPGTLATVNFTVVGSGDSPITIGPETRLKRGDGSWIVDASLMFLNIGHGYFRNVDPVPNHDVAATGIAFHHSIPATTTYSSTEALIYINTTLENQGDVPEIFDVDVYYIIYGYPTLVKSETIVVANGSTSAVSAGLNTTGFPYGFLTIKVEASEVYNEAETSDNTYNTTLLIKFTGDIVGDPTDPDPNYPDGDVDWFDFGAFAGAFGKNYPHALYDVECDFDRNGDIDWFDFGDFAANYGKSVPAYKLL